MFFCLFFFFKASKHMLVATKILVAAPANNVYLLNWYRIIYSRFSLAFKSLLSMAPSPPLAKPGRELMSRYLKTVRA